MDVLSFQYLIFSLFVPYKEKTFYIANLKILILRLIVSHIVSNLKANSVLT